MSASESLDDRDPPEFKFRQWLKQVAAVLAMMAAVAAAVLHFHPREQRTELQRQALLEILRGSQTLRPRADVEGCEAPQDSQRGRPARYSGSGRPDIAQAPE